MRRCAPTPAASSKPIRRHDAIEHPDVVVVLEPSLCREANVVEGLAPGRSRAPERRGGAAELAGERVVCVPASDLAASTARASRTSMLGAVAAALGEPPLDAVQDAAVEVLGAKVDAVEVRAAVAEGYECLS